MNYKKVITLISTCVLALGLSGCINPPDTSAINNSAVSSYNTVDTNVNVSTNHVNDYTLENNVNNVIDSLTPSADFLQHVSAVVWYGQTILVGQVQNQDLKTKIYNNVTQVYGIGPIYNEIVVNPNYNPKLITDANDTAITTAIKSKILVTRGLTSSNFKIVTSYGNVYILSSASPDKTAIVAQLARSVAGVNAVGILRRN